MDVTQPVVPAWVTPDPVEVLDLHAIAATSQSELARGCLDAVDWILDPDGPDEEQAQAEAAATRKHRDGYYRGISDTLAWLCGWISQPRLEIPRRNGDGSLPTADQLYRQLLAEYPAGWNPTPEQRYEARQKADVTAVRWARIWG